MKQKKLEEISKQNPFTKILEIIVDGKEQGNVHVELRGMKITFNKNQDSKFEFNSLMLNGKNYNSFSYTQYKTILENSLIRYFKENYPKNKIEIIEK